MTPSTTPDPEEQLFVEAARVSYRRLKEWERQHPDATLGEIEQKTREERRLLMGQLIPLLLEDRRRDDPKARPRCPKCGSGSWHPIMRWIRPLREAEKRVFRWKDALILSERNHSEGLTVLP